MQAFREAGYEVDVNFAPVIYCEGWLEDWHKLFTEINEVSYQETLKQLAVEIIFLTHNESVHKLNGFMVFCGRIRFMASGYSTG